MNSQIVFLVSNHKKDGGHYGKKALFVFSSFIWASQLPKEKQETAYERLKVVVAIDGRIRFQMKISEYLIHAHTHVHHHDNRLIF